MTWQEEYEEIKELVDKNGCCGLTFDKGDPEDTEALVNFAYGIAMLVADGYKLYRSEHSELTGEKLVIMGGPDTSKIGARKWEFGDDESK